MARVGITIDWDFFCPENVMWDMQHVESPLYLDFVWMTRGHLVDEYRTDGTEKTFWRWFYEALSGSEGLDGVPGFEDVTVGESHATVVKDPELWLDSDTIITFDQHHDCWAIPDGHRDEESGLAQYVACHTWGRVWLENNPRHKLVWVYPDSMNLKKSYGPILEPDHESDVCDLLYETEQLEILPCKEFRKLALGFFDPDEDELTGLHICRSGCWVPPWLDEDFCAFVEASGLPARVVYDLTRERETAEERALWDPFRLRWTASAKEAAVRLWEGWQHLEQQEPQKQQKQKQKQKRK